MPVLSFEDCPPESDKLTEYDERHLVTYLRLLDAAEEGADWRDVVTIIFHIDPEQSLAHVKTVYDSHLARARWMTDQGYRHLLRPSSA
jgi:hypothetical protein